MTNLEFQPFSKIPRWSRDIIITEKIDGTNACVVIVPEAEAASQSVSNLSAFIQVGEFRVAAQSRTRFITPEADNYGFATWVREHAVELCGLGPGRHFGEWWGKEINRNYGREDRAFSLFNVSRWNYNTFLQLEKGKRRAPNAPVPIYKAPPACCSVVPVLYHGKMCEDRIWEVLGELKEGGSVAKPGYTSPEGIVIFHIAGSYLFKKTFEDDETGKEV